VSLALALASGAKSLALALTPLALALALALEFVALDSKSADTQFQREPLAGSQNTHGWEFFAIFNCNRRLSMKRQEILLPWNVRKVYPS